MVQNCIIFWVNVLHFVIQPIKFQKMLHLHLQIVESMGPAVRQDLQDLIVKYQQVVPVLNVLMLHINAHLIVNQCKINLLHFIFAKQTRKTQIYQTVCFGQKRMDIIIL